MTLQSSLQTWAALRAGVVKPRTRDYHREIIGFIGRKWPEKWQTRVIEITDQDLGVFIARISHLSDTRFNGVVTMLRGTIPRAKNLRRRRLRIKERPLLNQLEFSRLLAELDRRSRSRVGLVVRFLAHTGLRINEARQITWRDVKPDFILVPGSISKSGKPRTIPFVNGICSILDELRSGAKKNGPILPYRNVRRALDKSCRRAGLPHLSHHDFRHLFATRCIESGVDVPTAARWLGHQDGGALLAKTYFHLVDRHSREMAARVEI